MYFCSEIEKPVMELVEQEEQEIVEEVVELAPEPEPETVAPHFVELLKDQVCLVKIVPQHDMLTSVVENYFSLFCRSLLTL